MKQIETVQRQKGNEIATEIEISDLAGLGFCKILSISLSASATSLLWVH